MNASHIKFAKKMFFNGVILPATYSSLTSLYVFRITVNLSSRKNIKNNETSQTTEFLLYNMRSKVANQLRKSNL